MNHTHLIRRRHGLSSVIAFAGSVIVVFMVMLAAMLFTSWYDVRLGEYGVGLTGRTEIDRIQPSLTRGIWVRYVWYDKTGGKWYVYWTLKPFRGVLWA